MFPRGERIADDLAQRTFDELGPTLGCVRDILDMMDPLEARGYLAARARRLLRDRLDDAIADAAWPKKLEREVLDAACRKLVGLAVRAGACREGKASILRAA